VEAIAPELAGRAEAICEALIEKDLVRPSGADSYVFRHILIREVAYQTLPRATRTALHAAAARWIEAGAAGREETVAELIAFHYREAASLMSAASEDDPESVAIKRMAVRWLMRAADAALASAANVEAARHLRAAIELAEPAQLVDLHERLGETFADAGGSIESYRRALELTDERADPDRALRLIGGILMGLSRSVGAVADRPTDEVMNALRARGATLLDRATERRAKARFHTAGGFHAFWLASDRRPTADEVAESERHATEGLSLAREIDDVTLQSAALDALSAAAMERGDWQETRDTARSRLHLGDRLDLAEKMDAYSVAAWASVTLGDLDDAVRISREGLALVQPGQVPALALHLVAWRGYALTLRGDWDEALSLAERGRELWIETGRIPAGYAMRGFFGARDVALARRQEAAVERLNEVIFGIADQFTPIPFSIAYVAALRFKPGALIEALRLANGRNPEGVERLLHRAVDRDEALPLDLLETARAAFAPRRMTYVDAAFARAIAVTKRDPALLREALATYQAMGARPLIARVHCDLGRLTGDERETEAGIAILRELGDELQLERVEG
ncbi:MAG TPA: hypothetical protein VKR80_06880, partial [Candidatus Limnocylindria bacterium]|nr:hypothetical protein [Candidatus Limnocylindria bacterium]